MKKLFTPNRPPGTLKIRAESPPPRHAESPPFATPNYPPPNPIAFAFSFSPLIIPVIYPPRSVDNALRAPAPWAFDHSQAGKVC